MNQIVAASKEETRSVSEASVSTVKFYFVYITIYIQSRITKQMKNDTVIETYLSSTQE